MGILWSNSLSILVWYKGGWIINLVANHVQLCWLFRATGNELCSSRNDILFLCYLILCVPVTCWCICWNFCGTISMLSFSACNFCDACAYVDWKINYCFGIFWYGVNVVFSLLCGDCAGFPNFPHPSLTLLPIIIFLLFYVKIWLMLAVSFFIFIFILVFVTLEDKFGVAVLV